MLAVKISVKQSSKKEKKERELSWQVTALGAAASINRFQDSLLDSIRSSVSIVQIIDNEDVMGK